MTYPPTQIHTPDNTVNVLHLTDLHLYANITKTVAGQNCQANFTHCLQQALADDIRCDLILVTGDLINEMDFTIYDRIFHELEETGIPFACLAGNHDVTDEVGEHLPFHLREFVAYEADPRLLDQHCIELNNWQILMLDSSIPGQVGGSITESCQKWLAKQLETSDAYTIVTLHHHIVPVKSAWVDNYITHNSEELWQLLLKYPQVKAVVTGHVHQEHLYERQGITSYITPATCYQFKPKNDIFALDENAKPGYRWLRLLDNGKIDSWVKRLET